MVRFYRTEFSHSLDPKATSTELLGCKHHRHHCWHTRSSLRPDAGCFHDWPPFLDLGFLQCAERFGRLGLGWWKLRPPKSARRRARPPAVSGTLNPGYAHEKVAE